MSLFSEGVVVAFGLARDGYPVWDCRTKRDSVIHSFGTGVVGIPESHQGHMEHTIYVSIERPDGSRYWWPWPAPGHPEYSPGLWSFPGYLSLMHPAYRTLRDAQKKAAEDLIQDALQLAGGSINVASKLLGMSYAHLRAMKR